MWAIPPGEGSPIKVRYEETEWTVLAGFGFRESVSAEDDNAVWILFDCVEAIVCGRAVEFYSFEGNFVGDERGEGVAGASFVGRNVSMTGGEDHARYAREIPAWSVQPDRPIDTVA